jgi:anti-sigma B factor antagonist
MSSHVSGTAAEPVTRPGQGGTPPDGQLVLGCDITASGTRIRFSGELDMASADRAFCYVCDVIDRFPVAVVLDMAELSFCDARGLAALLRMSRYAEQAHTALKLTSPSRQLLQILRITGLGDKLRVTNDPARPMAGPQSRHTGQPARRTHELLLLAKSHR